MSDVVHQGDNQNNKSKAKRQKGAQVRWAFSNQLIYQALKVSVMQLCRLAQGHYEVDGTNHRRLPHEARRKRSTWPHEMNGSVSITIDWTTRSPRAAERRAARVETVVTGTHKSWR